MYGCIGVCSTPIDFLKVHRKRIDIYSTEPKRDIDMRRFYEQGTQLVLDGLVNTAEIVTHRIPLSRIGEAFALRIYKGRVSGTMGNRPVSFTVSKADMANLDASTPTTIASN